MFPLVGLTDEEARRNDVGNHMEIAKIINYIKRFQSHVIYEAMTQASEQMLHVCPFHWTVDIKFSYGKALLLTPCTNKLHCLSGINTAPDLILGGRPFKLHLNFLRFS